MSTILMLIAAFLDFIALFLLAYSFPLENNKNSGKLLNASLILACTGLVIAIIATIMHMT
jgi:hypothetical protein